MSKFNLGPEDHVKLRELADKGLQNPGGPVPPVYGSSPFQKLEADLAQLRRDTATLASLLARVAVVGHHSEDLQQATAFFARELRERSAGG